MSCTHEGRHRLIWQHTAGTSTTAQLEALQAVTTMPPRVFGNGDRVAICIIEHPERMSKRMAALEARQNPTATFAKDRCPWDPQHGYGDGA